MKNTPGQNSPLLAAAALVGTGLLLRQWKPTPLDLPKADTPHADKGSRRKVRQARDGVAKLFMPENMMKSLGTSLLMIGGGLVAMRAFDEVVEEQKLF